MLDNRQKQTTQTYFWIFTTWPGYFKILNMKKVCEMYFSVYSCCKHANICQTNANRSVTFLRLDTC